MEKRRLPEWVIGCVVLFVAVPILFIVALLLPEPPGEHSPQSEILQSNVAAQILAWSDSEADTLDLAKLEGLKGFDHVCYVWQYQPLRRIEERVGPIDKYYSRYSYHYVPENWVALIGVRDRTAHVARIRIGNFSIGGSTLKGCAPVRSAMLKKDPVSTESNVLALLIDRQLPPPGYERK